MSKKRSKRKTSAKRSRPAARAAATRAGAAKRSRAAAAPRAGRKAATPAKRIAAITALSRDLCDDSSKLQSVIGVLKDAKEPARVRLAALRALQAAAFSVVKFNPCRGEYLAALRSVAEDEDPELRQRVLGLLAREGDGFVQERLLQGLKEPGNALVPPEKALQLLSYDAHGEAYSAARDIVSSPPSHAAKREALRLLAADASSAPVFEQILRDKSEAADIRQLSASALQSLAPQTLQAHAREMLLDASEKDEIQATSLTALTQFGEAAKVGKDAELQRRVSRLEGAASSAKVRKGARRFLSKYAG